MATKTISITTEAYERLVALKRTNESFSEIINNLTRKHSLLDLVGVLTHAEATALKKQLLKPVNDCVIKREEFLTNQGIRRCNILIRKKKNL